VSICGALTAKWKDQRTDSTRISFSDLSGPHAPAAKARASPAGTRERRDERFPNINVAATCA